MALRVVWSVFGFDDKFLICNMWNCGNQLSLIDQSEELLAVEPRKVQALFCSMDETN